MKKGVAVLIGLIGGALLGGIALGVVFSDYLPWNARWGGVVSIDTSSDCDLKAIGGFLELIGPTTGDLTLVGGHTRIASRCSGKLKTAAVIVEVAGRIGGKTRIFGATVYLDGIFEDTVEVYAGEVFVSGVIKGPLVVKSGVIVVEKDAVIEGKFSHSSNKFMSHPSAQISGKVEVIQEKGQTFKGWLAVTIVGLLFFLGIGIVMAFAFPWHLTEVTKFLISRPGKSALVGGLSLIAFPLLLIVGVLLAVTVIGATAGAILVVPYVLCGILSFLYVGTGLGRVVLSKLNKGREPRLIYSVLAGVSFVFFMCRIPYVGVFLYIVVFVFGMGSFLGRRIQETQFYKQRQPH